MTKKIVSIFLAIVLSVSLIPCAFADYDAPGDDAAQTAADTRAEELSWVYRVNDGKVEKRLWSNTYGVWRSDWIYVGPAS